MSPMLTIENVVDITIMVSMADKYRQLHGNVSTVE